MLGLDFHSGGMYYGTCHRTFPKRCLGGANHLGTSRSMPSGAPKEMSKFCNRPKICSKEMWAGL